MRSIHQIMQLRFLSTGVNLQASKMQLGRILNKVLQQDRTKKTRRKPVDPAGLSATFNKAGVTAAPNTTHKNRRVTILNKVFMKYITDLMATGEVASKLIGKGIEISHVNVAPDFSAVNVYWFAQNERNDQQTIEQILKVSAGHLQHELTQLRVIGQVPPINFVKNKRYTVAKEVEERLATVDFGEDFVPLAHIIPLKTPILETSLSEDLKARISSVDAADQDDSESSTELLLISEMRQDVMGFNHESVFNKVKSSMSKSKVAEQQSKIIESEPVGYEEPASSKEVVDYLSSKEQKKLFGDFLKKRAIEEKRKQNLVPLFEVKLEEEYEKIERMNSEYDDDESDIDIDEPYKDDLEDRR